MGNAHRFQNYTLIRFTKIILYFYRMGNTVYNIPINDIHGRPLNLANYKGKKILLVNTASECGLTPHYAQLQELYENYKDRLVVIGLPCNDFGAQEPGTPQQIEQFCQSKYNVTFPLTEKVKILGDEIHPLYAFLTKKELNGLEDSEVKWNFQKYLINENGELIKVFSPVTEPLSEELLKFVEA
jgi:glutathione peroxidase